MMKKIKIKSAFIRLFVLMLALVLCFSANSWNFCSEDDMKYIYGSFIGQKSPYNGMIEVWNIDSFESGLKSKVSYIETIAKRFQKKYKGVYLMVRNLTAGECVNLLKSGNVPDVVSCSYGNFEIIKDYVIAFENENEEVFGNFLNAGRSSDGKLYALAWCVGVYSLISTRAKIEKAGKEFDKIELNKMAYDLSYDHKLGKKIKTSKSLVFGVGDYLMPKNALKAYNKAWSIQIQESENDELCFKSQYSAYTSFLSNDATVLLGTHRDVIRMQTREENGKVNDVVYLPLVNWTDLVQFSFLLKNDNKEKKQMAEKFALFLTESKNQEEIEKIGMFPVVELENTSYNGVMRDIILENFSNCELKRVIL